MGLSDSVNTINSIPDNDLQDNHRKRLFKAAKSGNKKTVQSVLKLLEDVKFQDSEGRTPLHSIVESTTTTADVKNEIVRILVKGGVEINAIDLNGWTALLSASSAGALSVCDTLLKLGANPRLANEDLSTPLHYIVRHTYEEEEKYLRDVIELFKKKGANINERNKFEETPLHLACLQGDERLVRILVQSGAALNLWDLKGRTALHCAVKCNRFGPVQTLLSFEASFELRFSDTDPTAKELAESLNLINILRLFYAKDNTEYSLNILLNEEEDYQVFMAFLKKEFSTENLEFWTDVRGYRLIQEDAKRDQEAIAIYEKWIVSDELNISGAHKKEILAIWEQCAGRKYPPDIFDNAVIDVWMNMRDSYSRFVKTKQHTQLLANYRKRIAKINNDKRPPSPVRQQNRFTPILKFLK